MSKIYTSVSQLIGNTPLVELTNIERELELKAKLIATVELFNPAGSVKDRIAKAMIDDAEKKGLLHPGSVIIEPTLRPMRWNMSSVSFGSESAFTPMSVTVHPFLSRYSRIASFSG